ncbi:MULTISPECIES: OmpH family outer membrane protein [unclassified Sphingomonas]|jgi:Skp family chaperone for outer membrane proteins|uniref:OmpH family outer membrane protein n=1 Tax=unclassified Sphingomonas TaxID=196159 RepID=UPI000832E186|nr:MULTISPECIES: OmpH family outer membrane protein [unclassified Sphingomonas]MCH4892629.1 OmpH family outer membrane protein [Sphingomonas sp. SFZ2018-12]
MRIAKTSLVAAASFAALAATPAMAQRIPAATVAVVDSERVLRDCTACRAANTQLQGQVTSLQQLAQQLSTPLQTEQQQLQTAIDAAKGNPDAALQQRVQAFQTRQQSAQRQVAEQENTVQRNAAYVRQQIVEKMLPIVQQVAQQRGAQIAVDRGSVLFSAPTVDITDGVLTTLNQQLASVSVTAPPPPQRPAAGTAPAGTPAPATPRPEGR